MDLKLDPAALLALLERIGVGVCVVDRASGELVGECDAAAGLLGKVRGSLRNRACNEVFGVGLRELDDAAERGIPLRFAGTADAELLCQRQGDAQLLVLVRDARRERELERAYRSSRTTELFLEAVLEHIPDMIFVKDAKELRFVRFNKAGEELIGHPSEALLGKNDYDFFPKEQADFFTAKDRAVLAGGKLLEIPEEQIDTRHHGKRVLHTKKLPLLDEHGEPQYLLGISEDITGRKRAEAERDRSRSDVTQLELERELRERFVSLLTHDLRNPLAAARTAAEILRRDPDRDDLRFRLPTRIIDSIRRAERMVEDLLDVSQIRAGQPLSMKIEAGDLAALTADAIDELAVVHGERVVLETGAKSLPGFWAADKLRRVIENLVSNAIKYGDADSAVTVALESVGDRVRLKVHNLGPAIPADDLEHLFEPYARTRAASESGKKGWGLGLTLVRGIVIAHGGSVSVESTPGEGTTFTVELPRDARSSQATTH